MKWILQRTLAAGGLLLAASSPNWARPVIATNGIVSAASFKPVGVPGSAIAPGSIFAIFGAGLGPAVGVGVPSFPLQKTLAGVSISATLPSGAVIDAFPLYVSATQINAILPSMVPPGPVFFTVSYQDETSLGVLVQAAATSLGLFSLASSGAGPAALHNTAADGSLTLNTLSNPAQPGQVLVAYGTGLGAINAPDHVPPPAADLNVPVEILVAGRPARKLYAGRSPCCAGLDQVDFQLPLDVPTGCYVPLTINAGSTYSNYVTIAVSSGGGPCSDPANPLSAALASPGSKAVGAFALSRSLLQLSGTLSDTTLDTASAFFQRAGESFFSPDVSLPPPGSCLVLTFRTPMPPSTGLLDAGSQLRLLGPTGQKQVPHQADGSYFAALGGGVNLPGQPPPPPLYLVQGRYTAAGSGGPDVDAFSADLDLPDPSAWALTWTNRDRIVSVDRAAPLRVTWSAPRPDRGVAVISGSSTDPALGAGGQFVCVAPQAPGFFDVPVAVLGNLPVSTFQAGVASGALLVGNSLLGNGTSFSVRGLDKGVLYVRSSASRVVPYQ